MAKRRLWPWLFAALVLIQVYYSVLVNVGDHEHKLQNRDGKFANTILPNSPDLRDESRYEPSSIFEPPMDNNNDQGFHEHSVSNHRRAAVAVLNVISSPELSPPPPPAPLPTSTSTLSTLRSVNVATTREPAKAVADGATTTQSQQRQGVATLAPFQHEELVSDVCRSGFSSTWTDALVGCTGASKRSTFSCRGPRPFVCQVTNATLVRSNIKVCAGGEPLESVLNRPEANELPAMATGAVELGCDMGQDMLGISLKQVFRNPIMESIISSFKYLGAQATPAPCTETETRPTIAIARLDYADLLHTFSELYNTYSLLRTLGHLGPDTTATDLHQRVRLLILDGHAQGPFDDVWSIFDPSPRRVADLADGRSCFSQLMLVPPGPSAPIYDAMPSCPFGRGQPFLGEFVSFTASALGLPRTVAAVRNRVVIIQHRPRRVHPRQTIPTVAAGQILNLDEILDSLKKERPELDVRVVTLGDTSVKDMFAAVREAHAVVSLHSAPLAGWMTAGTAMVLVTHPRNRESYQRLASNSAVISHVYSPNWIAGCVACTLPLDFTLALFDSALPPTGRAPHAFAPGQVVQPPQQPQQQQQQQQQQQPSQQAQHFHMDVSGKTGGLMPPLPPAPSQHQSQGQHNLQQVAVGGNNNNNNNANSNKPVATARPPVYLLSGRFAKSVALPSYNTNDCFGWNWPAVAVCTAGSSKIAYHRQLSTDSTMLEINNFVVQSSLINISRGGEDLLSVLGRKEPAEFPVYRPGALTVGCAPDAGLARQVAMFTGNYMAAVVRNLAVNPTVVNSACSQPHARVGVFITREEYANLFHGLRDLLNVYHSLLIAGVITPTATPDDVKNLVQVVWLDGHAKGSLDEVWTTLFGPAIFISQLPSPTCFSRAILVHPGPRSVIHTNRPECGVGKGKKLINMFAQYLKKAYDLESVQRRPNLVTLIGRRKYVAHPRVNLALFNSTTVSREIVNEVQVVAAIKEKRPDLDARLIHMSPDIMSFRDQIKASLESQVIVAFHGAALAHTIFMDPPSSVLELSVPRYRARNHFALIARNMGSDYMMHVFPRTAELGTRNSDRFDIPIPEFLDVLAQHIPKAP